MVWYRLVLAQVMGKGGNLSVSGGLGVRYFLLLVDGKRYLGASAAGD
jgi:hypothetical protein